MSIFQVDKLAKSFGVLDLFQDLTFYIEKSQKVGLIAPNGAGKSTLLKILVGLESQDSGTITTQRDLRIAYLPQSSDFSKYPNVLAACISGIRPDLQEVILEYEEAVGEGDPDRLTKAISAMDALNGWDIEQELTALLTQLQLDNPLRSTQGLSGGQVKRIALASVLIGKPDLFILDEPTNHLDPNVIEWLEQYLASSNSALLMVTHDRYFLDQVCDTIFELDGGVLYTYEGNYTKYLEKREARIEQMQQEQATLRNLYRTELDWMRRMPQARGTKAKYRKDAFHEIEGKLQTISDHTGPKLESDSVYIGKKIFEAEHIAKSYGELQVIKDFTYSFARRDRVGVVGPNGAGKTTLINLIMGNLEPTSGSIEVGETVKFGYFSQIPPSFPEDKKVLDVVTDIAEHIQGKKGEQVSAMQLLNRFLFPPKRQQDYVAKLSGGERRRLQLCTVLMTSPNFLVLDEPTNDLDIPTLQVLEDYLSDFDGCILVVSHDRYFMDRVADHLFVLDGNGFVRDYPGNYTDYRQTKIREGNARKREESDRKTSDDTVKDSVTTWKQEKKKKGLSFKENKEFEALTAKIPEIQERLDEMEGRMSTGQLSAEDLLSVGDEYAKLKDELDNAEMRWLELSEIAEE
ncbi:ABC-F family ATP-binding cassette domain-containing protein [Porphyromonadaceae bacterium W3.11]|nr:ABC-F family ATP-binding cassette domain-containing protein [Porphyromonadaceae bacterium W3.11]